MPAAELVPPQASSGGAAACNKLCSPMPPAAPYTAWVSQLQVRACHQVCCRLWQFDSSNPQALALGCPTASALPVMPVYSSVIRKVPSS